MARTIKFTHKEAYGNTHGTAYFFQEFCNRLYGHSSSCPCARHGGTLPTSFVHENYYCESGSYGNPPSGTYFTRDPLWDGKDCPSENSCCSEPNLPWFYRQIPLTSDNNIEARICYDQSFRDEGVLVKETKLYIQ